MNDHSREQLEKAITQTWPNVTGDKAHHFATALSDCIREENESAQQAFLRNQQRTQQTESRR